MAQMAIGFAKQESQMSPVPSRERLAMALVRPQREQGRFGRGTQPAHRALPVSSRATTWRTLSQQAHAVAVWWRLQRGQTPPSGEDVSFIAGLAQRAHLGSGRLEPRALSSRTSRPTTGGAPVPSASGEVSKASARTWIALPLVAAASTASATALLGIDGSALAAQSMTQRRRSTVVNGRVAGRPRRGGA